jgi:hypothetical protein
MKNVIGFGGKTELSTLIILQRMKLSIMPKILSFKAIVMENEELLAFHYDEALRLISK